jgi:putative transcriptional regulator
LPAHHVPDEALLAYAAGTATAGEELLVACHLTLCPSCRAAADDAERGGEVALARVEPVPVADDALAAVLARLDAPAPAPPPVAECPVFPLPLRRRIGPLAALPWRGVGFDVRAAKVDVGDDQRVFLLDFPPRFHIPVHGHRGVERALVLRGGFSDETGHFDRGDVSWHDDAGHDVRIDPDGRCTTLFVNDGAAELGWLSGLVDWWIRR